MADRHETGKDGVLTVQGRDIPFTNVSDEVSFDTSSSDFNDGLYQDSSYVSANASLTVEADGSKEELKRLLINDDGTPVTDIRAQMTGSEGGDRFTKGKVTNFGREWPGGDKTTTEIELEFDRYRPV